MDAYVRYPQDVLESQGRGVPQNPIILDEPRLCDARLEPMLRGER
jgi:hypothetical protein